MPNSSRRRLFQGHTLSISEDEPTKLGTDIDLVHHGFQHCEFSYSLKLIECR